MFLLVLLSLLFFFLFPVVVVYFSTCGIFVAGLVLGFSKHAMFWLVAPVIAQPCNRPTNVDHVVSHFDKGVAKLLWTLRCGQLPCYRTPPL